MITSTYCTAKLIALPEKDDPVTEGLPDRLGEPVTVWLCAVPVKVCVCAFIDNEWLWLPLPPVELVLPFQEGYAIHAELGMGFDLLDVGAS